MTAIWAVVEPGRDDNGPCRVCGGARVVDFRCADAPDVRTLVNVCPHCGPWQLPTVEFRRTA